MISINLRDAYFSAMGGKINVVPATLSNIPEEQSLELRSSTETYEKGVNVKCLKVLEIDLRDLPGEPIFEFFVDGTESTWVIAQYEMPGLPPLPIIMGYAMAAACNRKADIKIRCECCALVFPHTALANYLTNYLKKQSLPDPRNMLQSLDSSGDFYNKCKQRTLLSIPVPVFFIDSARSFEKTENQRSEPELFPNDLFALGKVRRVALDRIKAVRRSLEVGIVKELRSTKDNEWILVDGPLQRMLFSMYGRLTDKNLTYLDSGDPRAFDFYKRVVGLVKEVRKIPADPSIADVFKYDSTSGKVKVPIYRIRDVYDNFKHLVCAYLLLRPELLEREYIAISPTAGLVRVDIPIPSIVDDYNPNWTGEDFIHEKINEKDVQERLEQIVASILALRYPLPETLSIHEKLTELYIIHQLENKMKALGLDKDRLRSIAHQLGIF